MKQNLNTLAMTDVTSSRIFASALGHAWGEKTYRPGSHAWRPLTN